MVRGERDSKSGADACTGHAGRARPLASQTPDRPFNSEAVNRAPGQRYRPVEAVQAVAGDEVGKGRPDEQQVDAIDAAGRELTLVLALALGEVEQPEPALFH